MGEIRQIKIADYDSEMDIVSGIVNYGALVFDDLVGENVVEDDFTTANPRAIWRAAKTLLSQGDAVNAATLEAELRANSNVVDPDRFIAEAAERIVARETCRYHGRRIVDLAIKRDLTTLCRTTLNDLTTDLDGTFVGEKADAQIIKLLQRAAGGRRARVMTEFVREQTELLKRMEAGEKNIAGTVSTGLPDLDRKLRGGLRMTNLVVIGGSPGGGKTALATDIVLAAAAQEVPSLVFSMEMTGLQIVERLSISRSKVDVEKLYMQGATNEEYARMYLKLGDLAKVTDYIAINDTSGTTLAQIRADTRRLLRPGGLKRGSHPHRGLVVVDYIQLAQSGEDDLNQEAEVAKIIDGLMYLAREENVTVIGLSQFNREAKKGQRPNMGYLRSSGRIEANAHVILLIHHPIDEETGEKTGDSTIIIEKNRNGPSGDIPVKWIPEETHFASRSGRDDDDAPSGGYDYKEPPYATAASLLDPPPPLDNDPGPGEET